jgi:hypothetical protein
MCLSNKDIAEALIVEIEYCPLLLGVKMAIWVILIRVNLVIYPIVCYRCRTRYIWFYSSSKILFVVAEGSYFLNKAGLIESTVLLLSCRVHCCSFTVLYSWAMGSCCGCTWVYLVAYLLFGVYLWHSYLDCYWAYWVWACIRLLY